MRAFSLTALMTVLVVAGATFSSSCATVRSVFAVNDEDEANRPIQNPFSDFDNDVSSREKLVLRTRKGDRAVEIELPRQERDITDLVIPLSPDFVNKGQPLEAGLDSSYYSRSPSATDRQIARTFPKDTLALRKKRQKIEEALGLNPAKDAQPKQNESYLARLDKVKQLYRMRRYEAGLIEIDQMIRVYPTDPKLYEMKGTLLSRLGYEDLALQSWEQSIELAPNNVKLKRFVDKRKRIPAARSSVNSRRPAEGGSR